MKSVEEMEALLRELYYEIFGEDIPSKTYGSNRGRVVDYIRSNPGLENCVVISVTEEGDIEIRFREVPECEKMREEYRKILRAALGGGETIYKTLKE